MEVLAKMLLRMFEHSYFHFLNFRLDCNKIINGMREGEQAWQLEHGRGARGCSEGACCHRSLRPAPRTLHIPQHSRRSPLARTTQYFDMMSLLVRLFRVPSASK